MAISKVRKLELVAHTQCRDETLKTLRALGSVHISDVREILTESKPEAPSFLKNSISEVESKLAEILYCSLFLERFAAKPSFMESIFKPKPIFTEEEVEKCLADFDLQALYEECNRIETELARIDSRIERLDVLCTDLGHWRRLRERLESVRDTRTTHTSLGFCDPTALKPMTDDLSEATSLFEIEVAEHSRTSCAILLIYAKAIEDIVKPILRDYGWHSTSFPELTETPAKELEESREQIKDLKEEREQIAEHIKKDLLSSREKLLLLYDHYSQELQTLQVQENFIFTSRTFLINGWVITNQEGKLKKRLSEVTDIVEVRCSDPTHDDTVPVLLDNRRLVEPFALVTELYGRPQYSEFDPTPLLAPFFAIFFGICLGDGGYGLILAIGALVGLKMLPVEGGARRLMKILFWSGVATAVVGVLSGGIFGIEATKLPQIFKKLAVINLTNEIILFLYLSFGVGIFHILFGIGIKLVRNVLDGDVKTALLEQGLWMLFILSVAPLGFKYLFGGNVGDDVIAFASKCALPLAILIVLFGARQIGFRRRHIGKHIGLGEAGIAPDAIDYTLSSILFLLGRISLGILFFFKSMIDYFGDVLSYSRLMALGLATAFLGMVINQMAGLVLGFPYGIGIVAFVLILVLGHTFNLVINCLSAFVHTLRLQYLEFFSKFFTGGGEPFMPFAEEREYTVIQPGVRDTT